MNNQIKDLQSKQKDIQTKIFDLLQKMEKQQQQQQSQGQGQNQPQQGQQGNQQGQGQNQQGDGSQQGQQQGQGQGQGQPQAGQGSMDRNNSPHVIDNHEIWRTGSQNPEDTRLTVQATISKATDDCIRQYGEGSIPDAIRNMINETLKPAKVNWKKVLQNYIGRKISFERASTRTRPNRRLGLKASGKKAQQGPKTLFAVDCSGSVSDAQYLEIMSEVKDALKNFPDKCDMVFFDYEMYKDKIKIGSMKQIPRRPLCGGTSFEPVMKYTREFKPDLLIVLTDGEAPTPSKPDCPVLWIILGGRDNPSLFGKRIVIDPNANKKVHKSLGDRN